MVFFDSFFDTTLPRPCEWTNHRAGSQLKFLSKWIALPLPQTIFISNLSQKLQTQALLVPSCCLKHFLIFLRRDWIQLFHNWEPQCFVVWTANLVGKWGKWGIRYTFIGDCQEWIFMPTLTIRVLPPILRNVKETRLHCQYPPNYSVWRCPNRPIAKITVEEERIPLYIFVCWSLVVILLCWSASVVSQPGRLVCSLFVMPNVNWGVTI